MKVLCLCQKGNSRSVVLAWLLRKLFKHETLAAGMTTASRPTRRMLYAWADRIILVVPRYAHWIPREYHDKLRVIDAGGDPFKGHDEALLKRYESNLANMDVVPSDWDGCKKCGRETAALHTCPFSVELGNEEERETLCNCCVACQDNCALDI